MKTVFRNEDLMNCSRYPIWFCTACHDYDQETVTGHFMHQILLILDGQGTLNYEDNTYRLKKGCAFFLKQGTLAQYINEGGLKSAFITAKGPAADILVQSFAPNGFLFFDDVEVERYQQQIKQILDRYYAENNQAELSSLVYSIFTEFLSKSKEKMPKKLDTVVKYINQNFAKKLTLHEIANHCYISTSKLCHDFKKHYLMSVFDYITDLRLENAYNILHSESNVSIKDVATRCGFFDSCYFCKAYKKKFGKTPTEM